MPMLFSPLSIKSITFRNRITVSPMCQYSSEDGFANDWHLVHLGSRAVGGAGIVITEATAVSPEGRISPDDLGIWKDEHIDTLQQITSFIHAQGSIAGIQLAHAGRKASTRSEWKGGGQISLAEGGWQTLSASALPFAEHYEAPVELDHNGIEKVKKDFTAAAQRALAAGFKLIELHAAHGYLLHQFLSPLSNKRNDRYGGNFENRSRLLLETIDGIKKVWPDSLPFWVRISATDWIEGGWDIDASVQLASLLKGKGVDLIDVSSGGTSPNANIPAGPGYQVPFAARIKKETGILTGAVGLITEAAQAEEILQENKADMIVMARAFLRDPYFPLHAAKALNHDLTWPVQYRRAKR
ncbi:MAG: NADH:flavin oxidoreductase/NADH oxidase [Sphingobacteriales bacterium]|nr:NADH:flavin oxidoreductase/NADH oxidase [Sphingobacteriales bacterium]OJY91457.1 MAG: oxidoreductase [Sphingobacteriales bacterium 44-15]